MVAVAPTSLGTVLEQTVMDRLDQVASEPAEETKEPDGETDAQWCARTAGEHGVVPHQSWGSLPPDGQNTWTARGCDQAMASVLDRATAAAAAAPSKPAAVMGCTSRSSWSS